MAGCSQPETHLIPAGYVGEVAILPGYREGLPARRERFAILFEIPPDGILVTQDLPSSRWHTRKYFYVDSGGRRQPIEVEASTVQDTPENRDDQRPIIAMETGIGEASGVDLPCTIYSVTYYVGTRADLLARTVEKANEQFFRVQDLVKRRHLCR
jgi:hypothetical protein